MKVVVYSHDADVRAQIKLAIGRRPAMDVPDAEIIEVATEPALFRLLDAGGLRKIGLRPGAPIRQRAQHQKGGCGQAPNAFPKAHPKRSTGTAKRWRKAIPPQ